MVLVFQDHEQGVYKTDVFETTKTSSKAFAASTNVGSGRPKKDHRRAESH